MIGSYFAEQPVSKFPLFLWSGYFLAGAAFTGFFFDAKDKTKFVKLAIPIAAIIMFVCYAYRYETAQYFGWKDWWQGFTFHFTFNSGHSSVILLCLFN